MLVLHQIIIILEGGGGGGDERPLGNRVLFYVGVSAASSILHFPFDLGVEIVQNFFPSLCVLRQCFTVSLSLDFQSRFKNIF